ncbi:DUF3455 domain-containing protein [Methylocella silvestris]|uniref:DUF3455 domain-containing protein n=1 Tax=Methylocella silvestris TaxID=199596 RepID=A0A2J7THQ7_METSI|nr:DUF3455 domain-containing protein [Methylocella silvestris]PNG26287.1 hypothetical protein CR492_09210 [Methylocella silvestris]
MKMTAAFAGLAALALTAEAAPAQDALSPPPGSNLLLEAHAQGVQVYVCTKKDNGLVWVLDGPAAALFNAKGREIGTHGKGPMWTLADGSAIVGEVVAKQDAPDKRSIPWLLVKVTSHTGTFGALTNAETVRRIDTEGGVAPPDGCDEPNQGDIARIRYSAMYQFYGQ